jgi:hypothetical protein
MHPERPILRIRSEACTAEPTGTHLHAKSDEWARKHASVFAPAKYELIYFIYKGDKKRNGDSTKAVDLGLINSVERVIEPK